MVNLFHVIDHGQDDVDSGILGEFVHGDDELVVACVVTGSVGILFDVVLAHLVDFVDGHARLSSGHILLLSHSCDTTEHGCLDEDIQVVWVVLEGIETASSGNDTRLLFGDTLEELDLGTEDILCFEQFAGIVGRGIIVLDVVGRDANSAFEIGPPTLFLAFELFDLFR